MDEDCLFLNVWSPTSADISASAEVGTNVLKPVMFYIHGGGFTAGSGADMLFESTDLARSTHNVVVTINYRLGPLGFLVTEKSGAGGMNGLADVILALEWVQTNIESFGGDPDRVMIFGESAGGCATCTLAVSGAAKGLAQSAIIHSGPCVGYSDKGWQPEPRALGLAQTELLMKQHNASSVDELRSVAASEFTSWPAPTGGYFLDNEVMPVQPSELYTRGDVVVDQMVIGGNSYDGTTKPPLNCCHAPT